eukprot:gnl/MRDRNA2_/MRDRNA2_93073_c0_seq1.p1 gnl/MRDRNA2_/MRDRNA2_93073_c0~~gnl/MRDRNA2_/MRDRNA2_93073_c0_seq1.p1  ORF type:complete len:247 (+),score=39.35 gnl/MRDRNA2_/MRDRNA2_93073_c0_seq1:73-813(+)
MVILALASGATLEIENQLVDADVVSNLRLLVAEAKGLLPEDITLVCDGMPLEDAQTIGGLPGGSEGASVLVLIRNRGELWIKLLDEWVAERKSCCYAVMFTGLDGSLHAYAPSEDPKVHELVDQYNEDSWKDTLLDDGVSTKKLLVQEPTILADVVSSSACQQASHLWLGGNRYAVVQRDDEFELEGRHSVSMILAVGSTNKDLGVHIISIGSVIFVAFYKKSEHCPHTCKLQLTQLVDGLLAYLL